MTMLKPYTTLAVGAAIGFFLLPKLLRLVPRG